MEYKQERIHMIKNTGLDHINSDKELTLHSTQSLYLQEYKQKNFENKEWIKFVNNCKGMIRTSIEYKNFVAYCKSQLGMTNCSFLGMVDDSQDVEIEIHHAIFTLHDIIEIVMDDMLRSERGISTLEVCNRVMKLHFKGLISIVPLSVTVHQLVHAHKINVHINQVYGDLIGFIRLFRASLTEEHIKKVRFVIEASKKELHGEELLKLNEQYETSSDKLSYEDLMKIMDNVDPEILKQNQLFQKKESKSGTRKKKFQK